MTVPADVLEDALLDLGPVDIALEQREALGRLQVFLGRFERRLEDKRGDICGVLRAHLDLWHQRIALE